MRLRNGAKKTGDVGDGGDDPSLMSESCTGLCRSMVNCM
jgi:hypothetical protein